MTTIVESHAPFAQPQIASDGTWLFVLTTSMDNEGTLWRIDPEMPDNHSAVDVGGINVVLLGEFSADGRLVLGDDQGDLHLYTVGA